MDGPLFLGVDGGSSRCRARLRNVSGKLLGEGISGPANVSMDSLQARTSIIEATARALQASGLNQDDLARCHAGLGLAGAGPTQLQNQLLDGWNTFASVQMSSDAYVAWLGAHGGEDGAVVILGTGSVGYGHIGPRRHMLAGWGPEISDEAGAAALGREALRRSIWAWDGRIEMTPLAENLLSVFEGSPAMIATAARKASPADYAAYAPLVFQFADQGDRLAIALLHNAVEHVVRMIERLSAIGFSRIATVGGMAEAMMPWLPPSLCADLSTPKGDANDGAIMMIRRAYYSQPIGIPSTN